MRIASAFGVLAGITALASQATAIQGGPCPPNGSAVCPPGSNDLGAICFSDSFGPQQPPWDSDSPPPAPLSIPRFNPGSNGIPLDAVLRAVDIELTGMTEPTTITFESRNVSSPLSGEFDFFAQLTLEPVNPIAGLGQLLVRPEAQGTIDIPNAAPDTTCFNAPAGANYVDMVDVAALVAMDSASLVAPGDNLGGFEGPGNLLFRHTAIDQVTSTIGANVCIDVLNSVSVRVDVTYSYCIEGCINDCDNDGICDEDEPDCDGDGTPDDCEPDCDNDGTPDDCDRDFPCDCVNHNRRECGSLLLFPEFDNRQADQTLVTVTRCDCEDFNGDDIWVEFVYINKDNCLETNITRRLTPCDTVTLITSFDNPNMEQGYLYVFAKDGQFGQPVVHNHLMGNLLVINGIHSFQYSMNPVSLQGVGEQGELTDRDGDGIRDLDNVEYIGMPERVLIPRFLGQDNPFNPSDRFFASELILINLSGGRAFTTEIDMLIFNDNEEPFSRTYEFYCWEKSQLADINLAFTEDFLDTTDNDPTEILGANDRESGWFWVDGKTANSTQEQILDPVVYAVLVERIGTYGAADLPWELCTQENGDLLPTGLFGDGPDYVAGDNE